MSVPMMQDSAPDALKGGNRFIDERRGNEASQAFPLTGAKGTKQVDNDQPASSVSPNSAAGAASRTPEDVSGMNAGSGRAINVKLVDANHLEGSNKGDHRTPDKDTAKASLAKAADNGGPRKRVGQFANNGKTPQDAGFQSYPGNTADSDAGN